MATDSHLLGKDADQLYLTDGGLETTLIFHDGYELPCFAAFDLLKNEAGTERLRSYYQTYIDLALTHGYGFVLESATWRASTDWGTQLGYSSDALATANRQAIDLLQTLRAEHQCIETPMLVSGNLGPRGDGYLADQLMTTEEAQRYHCAQITELADAGADIVTALTMTYSDEAIGIVKAAQDRDIPVVIAFTVETDGRLPSGQPLGEAITAVDHATNNGPAYYMLNCAHPTHFMDVLPQEGQWLARIQGLRANASCMSHAELDNAETLDDGNPEQLAKEYAELRALLPNLRVLGGCCGTDHRHIEAIAKGFKAA